MVNELTPKQQRFVEEYMVDMNASDAARRAGYSQRTAARIGFENLQKVQIAAAIDAARIDRSKRVGIEADEVLRGLAAIARADARELIEFRRTCCRYCWGTGFRWHRTAGEMERDRETHELLVASARASRKKHPGPFDEKGGIGYHAKRDPNPECPECFGDGVGQAFVHDTRRVSPEAARLYAGVKVTREGIEIKTHSPPDALVQLGKHLGLFDGESKGDTNVAIVINATPHDQKL
jgi:phage terminase small subunit